MFCANCGNQIADGIKFCGRCGSPTNMVAQPAVLSVVVAPQSTVPEHARLKKFALRDFPIFCGLIIILAVIGAVSGPVATKNIQIIINFFLGIISVPLIFAIPAGIVTGIVYLTKMSGEQELLRGHYQRVALWWFFGPVSTFVFILILYSIINVIFSLAK